MLDHLSSRTRQFVQQLIEGKSVTIGGKVQGPLKPPSRELLRIIATQIETLGSLKGADLINEIHRMAKLPAEVESATPAAAASAPALAPVRIAAIRAHSFRGIAPAHQEWDFDFEQQSHLLYGPNGCGKSSLLGAICWCLTGRIFRDDCPPSHPADIPVYSTDKKPKAEGTRPDALALIKADGTNCPATDPYWVELQFVSIGGGKQQWLKRHSHDGLSHSTDGVTWKKINAPQDIGISELDIELRVLMPARVGHLRFGKDDRILGLFSQIVGLDALELISDISSRSHAAMVKEANSLKTSRHAPLERQIEETVSKIQTAAQGEVREWPTYLSVASPARMLENIKQFRTELSQKLEQLKAQLAVDLSITLPEDDSPEAKALRLELDNLPGHIDTSTTRLSNDLGQLFSTSLGLPMQTPEALAKLRTDLASFVDDAQKKANERLTWARKEKQSAKAKLMLTAAGQFSSGSNQCPVCTQDLKSHPAIRTELEELRELSKQSHLYQSIADLERSLISELNKCVSAQLRQQSSNDLGTRLKADWDGLKSKAFLGLVKPIADKFDASIEDVAKRVPSRTAVPPNALAADFQGDFPDVFAELDREIAAARTAQMLQQEVVDHQADIREALTTVLISDDISLSKVLSRGQATNRQIKELNAIAALAEALEKAQRDRDGVAVTIKTLNDRAEAIHPLKDLGTAVRQETINVVKAVEPVMKSLYEKLYDSEHLLMDMVTTGHAANPNVKDEFNIYLRAGTTRLPASPFANAGRLRAIGLCFAFALQSQCTRTLQCLILDDPAISLDDEHKARFVDHLVMPHLSSDQVIMATHYENFFKCAQPCFKDAIQLQLAPRRSAEDAVAFEPSDLLQRVESALQANSTSWREMGVNLRRWAERALGTLSGYCPIPFVIFNNIPDSVKAYAAITDTRVKSDRRGKIVAALQSPQFERIMHRAAHDEDPTETEIRDGWKVLAECRKEVEAEIVRFQGLYRHALLKRGIAGRPVIAVLGIQSQLPSVTLEVAGRAAAAADGIGITWTEDDAETLTITNHQIGLVKADVLAPIATTGQYVVLDVDGETPNDGDLVAVKTKDGKAYLRRLWQHEALLNLEATNPTMPTAPAILSTEECEARRVVGIIFDGPTCAATGVGKEWVAPGQVRAAQFSGTLGIRVDGTSLEPIARDGQVVLVRKVEGLEEIEHGQLACIDIEERGAVLKRCYRDGDEWILCPVNPVDVEVPIRVSTDEILHAYRIVGVLFEPILQE